MFHIPQIIPKNWLELNAKRAFIAFYSQKCYANCTMSLTRQIAHNTGIQIIGKAITTLLGLLAIAMMTRYLGAEQFGWYVTAISFLQFAGILIDFGLIPVTAQMMSEEKFGRKELFQNLLGFRFVTALICLLFVPLLALLFPYPPEVKIAIALSTISFFAISINQILTGFFQTQLKMHLASLAELVGRMVLVGGLYGLIHFGASFIPIMILISISTVVYTIVLLFFTHKYIPLGLTYNKAIWKAIATKMWPITLSIIFNVVYLKGDILLLSLYRTQEEVGLYGAAYRVIDIITQIAMLSIGIMLPLLAASWAKNNTKEFSENYERSVVMMALLGFPLATGAYMLSGPIMDLVAGNEFAGSSRPLQILSLAVIGLFLGSVYGHIAVAINKQRSALYVYISAAILTLAGYLFFVPKFGMIGAAWMSVFSEIFVGLGLFLMIGRFIQVSLPYKFLFKTIFSTLIMGVALSFAQDFHVVLSILIGLVVYGVSIVLTKAISKETIQEIISLR